MFGRLKNRIRPAPRPATPEEVGAQDNIGIYGRAFRTGDPVRAVSRGLRLSVLLNVILAASALSLASALASLTPLRQAVPYLVQMQEKEAALVRLEPFVASSDRIDNIAEQLVVNWTVLAHEMLPDSEAMRQRWGAACLRGGPSVTDNLCAFMYKHSSEGVYRRFVEANSKKISEMLAARITRRVIIDAEPTRKGPKEVEVRFTLIETQPDDKGGQRELRKASFIANVWYEFIEEEVPHAERFLNPLGFKVVNWTRTALESAPKRTGL